jgi:hypothetical protein
MVCGSIYFATSCSVIALSAGDPLTAGLTVTSICKLSEGGRRLSGAHVRVTAIYSSDLLERSTITDDDCPSVILVPYDAPDAKLDSASMRRFNNALQGELSDRSLRKYLVDVSGKYVWRENEIPHGAIYIEKVWSFKRL